MEKEELDSLLAGDYFSHIDRHFSAFIARISDNQDNILALSSALVSRMCRDGHTCIDIDEFAGQKYSDIILDTESEESENKSCNNFVFPYKEEWIDSLSRCSAVAGCGEDNQTAPLFLSGSRLYLKRYYDYQEIIADKIKQLSKAGTIVTVEQDYVKSLFTENEQMEAALKALNSGFAVITGGPGTGKTTTVTNIMALLLKYMNKENLKIRLAAPTGKAADRMVESISKSLLNVPCSDEIKAAIPREASTLHRLLGAGKNGLRFKYGKDRKLELDVLIIDEASMIDIAMMARLCEALPDNTKLILLGDSNQLSSVEPGSVLADLCRNGKFVATLKNSHRFTKGSAIGEFSIAVNENDAQKAMDILTSGFGISGGLSYYPAPDKHLLEKLKSKKTAEDPLYNIIKNGYKEYFDSSDIVKKFELLTSFCILCAVREGPYGTGRINSITEKIFSQMDKKNIKGEWYENMLIMITRNDYSLGLYNGDRGIVFPDPDAGGELKAWFQDDKKGYKKLSRFILPEYEKVYSMTVHKSQGSEFKEVVLILPENKTGLLSCELIYTAITRAQKRVRIFSDKEIFMDAVSNRTIRSSGLLERMNAI